MNTLDSYTHSSVLYELNLEKICEQCGKKYQPRSRIQRFCSNECRLLYRREWARQRPKKSKAYYVSRIKLMNHLGGQTCVDCGCKSIKILQLHHINNDGKEDKLRFNYSVQKMIYYYLENLDEAKEKLQVLCRDCNHKKRWI